ncbi:MAG: HAD hydrolase-like protein [Deltaproteobacteria bacterium]|nr:HAD hydrolase-like protein [Deltaproteobacteria bacterium]
MNLQNIIFDWSGTLFDDFEISHHSTVATLKAFGGKLVSIDDYKEHFVLPAWKFYRYFLKNADMDAVTHFYFEHFMHHIERGRLFPKARENLKRAHRMGYKLFICSTVRQDLLEKMVRHLKIDRFFDGIFGSVRDKEKRLPNICRRLGLKKDRTIFAGDMEHDVAAAKKAGVLSAAFLCGYQTPRHLLSAAPDFVWNDHGSLGKFLNKIPPNPPLPKGGVASSPPLSSPGGSAFGGKKGGQGGFPLATVGALIFNRGDIFLVQTHKWSHTFGIPGGKIKKGETMEEALRREIFEETGMKIKKIRFAMVQDSIDSREFYRPHQHFLLINFYADTDSRKFRLNDESESGFWVNPRTALKLRLNQPTRILLEHYFKT